jgi:hypothetical protein
MSLSGREGSSSNRAAGQDIAIFSPPTIPNRANTQTHRREMSEHQIRFGDGAAHERMMGTWSRLAGGIFLDWLTPPPGLRWIDVGCRPSPTALA